MTGPKHPANKPMKPRSIYFYLVLAFGTAICFWQVRHFELLNYDDISYVTKNPHVLNGFSLENIAWAFTSSYQANWHPLTWLSLMLDCQLFGINSGEMHLINLFLHISNTLLLFALIQKNDRFIMAKRICCGGFCDPSDACRIGSMGDRTQRCAEYFILTGDSCGVFGLYQKRTQMSIYADTWDYSTWSHGQTHAGDFAFVLLILDYWPLNRFELQSMQFSDHKANRGTSKS